MALQTKPKTSETFCLLLKHWHFITDNPKLAKIFPGIPIVAYKKEKLLKDFLVRAKIPSIE